MQLKGFKMGSVNWFMVGWVKPSEIKDRIVWANLQHQSNIRKTTRMHQNAHEFSSLLRKTFCLEHQHRLAGQRSWTVMCLWSWFTLDQKLHLEVRAISRPGRWPKWCEYDCHKFLSGKCFITTQNNKEFLLIWGKVIEKNVVFTINKPR